MLRRLMPLVALVAPLLVAGCKSSDAKNGVLPGVQALLFVKRAYVEADGSHNVSGGNRQTIDYLRYTPGGGLFVLSPPRRAVTSASSRPASRKST